jgi:ABC-type uncharacterized transport system fused permease/ATPase subunit
VCKSSWCSSSLCFKFSKQYQSFSCFTGEFSDNLDQQNQLSQANANTLQATESNTRTQEQIVLVEIQELAGVECASGQPLLEIQHLTLYTPQYTMTLIEDLSIVVKEGESLMVSRSILSLH